MQFTVESLLHWNYKLTPIRLQFHLLSHTINAVCQTARGSRNRDLVCTSIRIGLGVPRCSFVCTLIALRYIAFITWFRRWTVTALLKRFVVFNLSPLLIVPRSSVEFNSTCWTKIAYPTTLCWLFTCFLYQARRQFRGTYAMSVWASNSSTFQAFYAVAESHQGVILCKFMGT